MAAHMCSMARKEYDEDLNYVTPPAGACQSQERFSAAFSTVTGLPSLVCVWRHSTSCCAAIISVHMNNSLSLIDSEAP